MNLIAVIGLSLSLMGAPANDSPEGMRLLYHKGVKEFQAGKFDQAKATFRTLLPLLKKTQTTKRKKGTKDYHLMTLGQCDVLFHLAQIAEKKKRSRRACLIYKDLIARFGTVPKAWSTWSVYPSLPGHMTTARQQWGSFCPKVPSIVTVAVVPKGAKIEKQTGPNSWQVINGNELKHTGKTLTLRITAEGYEPKLIQNAAIPQWGEKKFTVSLNKKKKVAVIRRPPPRRTKPKPKPITSQAWFWGVLAGGVILIGGGVAAIVVLNQPQTHVLGGKDQPYDLW